MCCENAEYAKQKNAYIAERNMSKKIMIRMLILLNFRNCKSEVGEVQCEDSGTQLRNSKFSV